MMNQAEDGTVRQIATVVFVQIQRSPMKAGTGYERVYDPAPLLRIDRILLTGDGIYGIAAQGEQVIDVHHVGHPQSRFRGDNRISFGFLEHYASMRQRFGSHLVDGVAGENILLRTVGERFALYGSGRLVLKNRAGDVVAELASVIPAPPCREFSEYCARFPLEPHELKATLQFLGEGMRGYYAELADPQQSVLVQAGDTLWSV